MQPVVACGTDAPVLLLDIQDILRVQVPVFFAHSAAVVRRAVVDQDHLNVLFKPDGLLQNGLNGLLYIVLHLVDRYHHGEQKVVFLLFIHFYPFFLPK